MKPKLLLLGLRRSGKSSIQQVVFHKMSPNETLFLESTVKVQKEEINQNTFIQFDIYDYPGQIDYFDSTYDTSEIFSGVGTIVFVIDAQDDYLDALSKLYATITQAHKINSRISFEIFIHKVDGLSEDHKIETQRDIQQRISDELMDAGLERVQLSFHLTSIYDHSIFEAFSKVIQKLTPQLGPLENLLNILCSNSGIEKAFLFDILCKVYIATDSSPVDMQSYELCSDMIDVVVDISCIYGTRELEELEHEPTIQLEDTPERTASDVSNFPLPSIEISHQTPSIIPIPYDSSSQAVIRLNNGTVLFLRHISQSLALVGLMRGEQYADRKGWLEVNCSRFKQAMQRILQANKR